MTSSLRKAAFAALISSVAILPVSGQAQSLFTNEAQMDDLAKEMQGISTDITSSMQDTQDAIKTLIGENGGAGADAVRQYFDNLETQARTILAQVSVNSNFMDALDAADRRLGIMQKRFEADVKASGGEDARALQRLERIQKARQDFTEQMKKVHQTEKDIVELILQNSQARDDLIIDGGIRDAEMVVAALSRVTDGLQDAADKLQEISTAALARDDVSNIATE